MKSKLSMVGVVVLALCVGITGCKKEKADVVGTYRCYKPSSKKVIPLEFEVRKDGTATLVGDAGTYEVDGDAVFFLKSGARQFGFRRIGGDELVGNAKIEGMRFGRVGTSKELKQLDENLRIEANLKVLAGLAHEAYTADMINSGIGGGERPSGFYSVAKLRSTEFVKALRPVAGEDYTRLVINVNSKAPLEVTTIDGRKIEYRY